jgi:Mn-dependent DtxR family transcriptional regulator
VDATPGPVPHLIHYFIKLNCDAPAHADFQRYFRVSPPVVNTMLKNLEARGLIERTPGVARALRLLVPREALPDLD